jgi:3-phenylpropionate/trans-cinnamate dioxygenase ferredoxin subunit
VSGAVRLCAAAEIESGTARRFDVEGRRVAVVRLGDDFYALGDTCSHADVSLSEGEVLPDTLEIECWKHGSAFSLETGEPSCLPAVRPVPTYEIRVEGDDVMIELGADGGRTPSATKGTAAKGVTP